MLPIHTRTRRQIHRTLHAVQILHTLRTRAGRRAACLLTAAALLGACRDQPPTGAESKPALAVGGGSTPPICALCGVPIVFEEVAKNGISHYIWKMNTSGTGATLLHAGSQPTWAAGYSRIVFSLSNTWIAVMNSDGTNVKQLSLHDSSIHDYWPAVSPDGTKIAFTRSAQGQSPQLYVMNADGTNVTQLTNFVWPNMAMHPSWSPDGTKIAFSADMGYGSSDIFVMNANGDPNTLEGVAATSNADSNPVWSPDGSLIAFTSTFPYLGIGTIVIVSPYDVDLWYELPTGYSNCQMGAFSPFGDRLTFSCAVGPTSENWAIFSADLNGGNRYQLTSGLSGKDTYATWSRR